MTMESLLPAVCCLAALVYGSESQRSLDTVVDQMRSLNEEVLYLKTELPRIEDKLANEIEMSELALKSVVEGFVKSEVRQMLRGLFREEPLDQMVESRMTKEIRDLKRQLNRLKQEQNFLSRVVSEIRGKNSGIKTLRRNFDTQIKRLEKVTERLGDTLEHAVEKVKILEGDNSQLMRKSNTMLDKIDELERKVDNLEEQNEFINNVERDGVPLRYLRKRDNETLERIGYLESRQEQLVSFKQTLKCDMKYAPSTPPVTLHTKRTRLLITDFYIQETRSHQLSLDGNELSSYPYLQDGKVTALAYDPSTNQIVYSRYYPDGIYGMKLDGSDISYIYLFMISYGIAIDEARQLIFMTIAHSRKSLCRITTHGRDFTYIKDMRKYNTPTGIALDAKNNLIYMSNHNYLFSIDYYGNNLQILHTGSNIRGVALDLDRNNLYFNDFDKIMRRPVTGNSSEEVAQWVTYPLNMKYYNDTVYVSSSFFGEVYALDVNSGNFSSIVSVGKGPLICLIP